MIPISIALSKSQVEKLTKVLTAFRYSTMRMLYNEKSIVTVELYKNTGKCTTLTWDIKSQSWKYEGVTKSPLTNEQELAILREDLAYAN